MEHFLRFTFFLALFPRSFTPFQMGKSIREKNSLEWDTFFLYASLLNLSFTNFCRQRRWLILKRINSENDTRHLSSLAPFLLKSGSLSPIVIHNHIHSPEDFLFFVAKIVVNFQFEELKFFVICFVYQKIKTTNVTRYCEARVI